MSNDNGQINEKFLSFSPPIVPWYQTTTLSIAEPISSKSSSSSVFTSDEFTYSRSTL